MIIRVELKDIENPNIMSIKYDLFLKPNCNCLTDQTRQIKPYFFGGNPYVYFWYLDDSTPINDIEALKSNAAVHSVTVLPNNTNPYPFIPAAEWKNLMTELFREYGEKTQ